LNVTRVLKQVGNKVIATGLLGGVLGIDIQKKLSEKGIEHRFFEISGETRNCIAILHEGKQTEILEDGPVITLAESEKFLQHFEKLVKTVQIISISGSFPKGIEDDYYSKIIQICNKYTKPVVLDCSGKALLEVLKHEYKPKVIKPNIEELSQLIGKNVSKNQNELKEILEDKLFENIEWIIVSLGADGAFAKHNDKFYKVNIPKIEVVNPVGSGDSTVAGIISAIYENTSDENLLKKANTLGMLNAMENLTGFVNLEKYDEIFNKIEVIDL
ncbi:MAG: tagatose-6-phosphate kinase, partial [Leptotrichiaceae bacterium]